MEAKLLMITTIMTATMTTIETLKVVCQDIDGKAKASDLTSIECNLNPEVQALASLAQKCHSYKESVEVMQNRVGKLIDLVSRMWCPQCPYANEI